MRASVSANLAAVQSKLPARRNPPFIHQALQTSCPTSAVLGVADISFSLNAASASENVRLANGDTDQLTATATPLKCSGDGNSAPVRRYDHRGHRNTLLWGVRRKLPTEINPRGFVLVRPIARQSYLLANQRLKLVIAGCRVRQWEPSATGQRDCCKGNDNAAHGRI